jgi:SulP family sulfate permease
MGQVGHPGASARGWPVFNALSGATPASLGHDLVAGLTLAAIAVPVQMATARLGGFPPQVGFIAFVALSLGFAAFGANRQLAGGADSTITPIFAGSLALLAAAGSPQYAELAAVLAVLVGLLLTAAGVFRLGWIADLLSMPVITGFLAGIALHIVLSQAPSVLGVPASAGDVYHQVAVLAAEVAAIKPASVAIGLGVFAVTVGAARLSARIPGALIALVGATLATSAFGLNRSGVAVLGQVRGGFPRFALPAVGFESALPLVGLAFVIALVVMVQTAATTDSVGDDDNAPPDVNRDFVGVGVGSVIAGLFGAFPVDASPPMSSIVAGVGGRSQFAGLFAALAVLLLAGFGTPLLANVPVAALGGVLLFVALRIFHAGAFADLLRRAPAEFALALLTTALIVVLPIQTGVAIGMFLSMVHGVFTVTRARVIPFERVPDTTVWWPVAKSHPGETQPGVLVMGFQAPLSFLNAKDFGRELLVVISGRDAAVRLLVLEASSIVEIDFTAASVLSNVIAKAHGAGMDFAVARLESVRAQAAFDRFGITQLLGEDHVFRSVEQAIRTLQAAAPGLAGAADPAPTRCLPGPGGVLEPRGGGPR